MKHAQYLSIIIFMMLVFSLSACQNTATSDADLNEQAQLEPTDPLAGALSNPANSKAPTDAKIDAETKAKNQVNPSSEIETQTANVNCSDMAQSACLASKQCILSQNAKRAYVCRPAKDSCEMNFIQTGNTSKQQCANNKTAAAGKCYFKQASCFCPQGMQCICGGGNPSMCSATPFDNDAAKF